MRYRAALVMAIKSTGTPKVGQEVDANCTRCKMLLNHVVVAKVGEVIKRVKCLTCGSDHVFRDPNSGEAKKARSPAATATAPKPKRAAINDYDEAMRGKDLGKATRYKPVLTLSANQLVDHPKFGFGVVTDIKEGGKVDVIFREGTKTLVHGLSA